MLLKLRAQDLHPEGLAQALAATSRKRGSAGVMKNYRAVMELVRESPVMNDQWKKYQGEFSYAADIPFPDTCHAVETIMDRIRESLLTAVG